MKNKVTKYIILTIPVLVLFSCFLFDTPKPTQMDGSAEIVLQLLVDDNGDTTSVAGVPVSIRTYNYNIPEFSDTTDSNGVVHFYDLPFASYYVQAFSVIRASEFEEIEIVGSQVIELVSDSSIMDMVVDTMFMEQSKRGLKINEVYSPGPPNNIFYFYDQFHELYNGLSETVYLDGMIYLRLGTTALFADTLKVTNIYQFPGTPITGREYPLESGEFAVLAMKAMDHNIIGPISGKTIDLSGADWEFVNMMEPGAYDNPNVPNLTTNNGSVTQKSMVDFMVGVTGDGLALCNGLDTDITDGIDISTVIDAIEYSSSATHQKEVPYILDASCGGLLLERYSGQSVERIRPGFDSNNSAVDFVVINAPTPGSQHE